MGGHLGLHRQNTDMGRAPKMGNDHQRMDSRLLPMVENAEPENKW